MSFFASNSADANDDVCGGPWLIYITFKLMFGKWWFMSTYKLLLDL